MKVDLCKMGSVVAQLVEQSLPTPEIRGSNPDIGKILSANSTIEKAKNKEKEAGNGPSLKKVDLKKDSTIDTRLTAPHNFLFKNQLRFVK